MIRINNKTYNGNSVIISNNKIIIDGVDQTPDSKNITINVVGNLQNLEVDSCESLKIDGNCYKVSTVSGDVICYGIEGNVSTVSGDVECKIINGDVSTVSGDIG